jgi:hypothetical protein
VEILINELSLSGQFASADHFINDALHPLTALLNEIDYTKDLLYKRYDFYNSLVTAKISIHHILMGAISRQYDEVRKFKSQLAGLFENPYWEDDPRHSTDSVYLFNGNDVSGQSIAEACERDKIVVSFMHPDFASLQLLILKEQAKIELDNLFEKGHYTEAAWKRGVLTCEDYCTRKFSTGKLNFSKIDKKEGFALLKKEDEALFIDGFRKFTDLTWPQINVDDALDYKEYKDSKGHFKGTGKKIHKFRISQKYRCFGYVEEGVFYTLLFDLTHKLSDAG